MDYKRVLITGIVVLAAALAGAYVVVHKDVGESPRYVTSEECRSCHESLYEGWKDTLHKKMFRPVSSPATSPTAYDDNILGDFSSNDPALTFSIEDVEYIIGNKWEQVYMKMVDGDYRVLPAKWYIQKKQWVPFMVETWRETSGSEKCNGCHVTGFDAETYDFTEFGIGCEACHGPGSTHVLNRKKAAGGLCSLCHERSDDYIPDIINSVNGTVCGRCHNRGNNLPEIRGGEAKFEFPVTGKPGDDLQESFKELRPEDDKNGKFWWGNGISKNRHQEFADWQNSEHSKALSLMKEKHTGDRGEITTKCLQCHSTDYRLAGEDKKPDVKSARYGVTCVACHDPHGRDRSGRFKRDGRNICGGCHIDSMSVVSAGKGKRHYPCPQTAVECADCHMPFVVTSGGSYSIRGHAFKIIKPSDTELYGTPNSCQNGSCHTDRTIEWAVAEYDSYYPAPDIPKDMRDGALTGTPEKTSPGL